MSRTTEDEYNELYNEVLQGYPKELPKMGHPEAPTITAHSVRSSRDAGIRPLPPTPGASGSGQRPYSSDGDNKRPLPVAPGPVNTIDGRSRSVPPSSYRQVPSDLANGYPHDKSRNSNTSNNLTPSDTTIAPGPSQSQVSIAPTPPEYGSHKSDELLPAPTYPESIRLAPSRSLEQFRIDSGFRNDSPSPYQPEASQQRFLPIGSFSDRGISPHSSRNSNSNQQSTSDSISYIGTPPRHTSTLIYNTTVVRRPTEVLRVLGNRGHRDFEEEIFPDNFDEFRSDSDSGDSETQFVNFSLLSHLAVLLRDKVPRGTHVKGSIPYPRAFTGKDIVSTIQSQIQRELVENHGGYINDRRAALVVARSLQSQLFFYEVEWGAGILQDGVEDVYMFLDDQEVGLDAQPEREELPTGLLPILAKCYSPSCEGPECYVYGCPRKGNSLARLLPSTMETPSGATREAWPKTVPPEVLQSLPESEIRRQIIIHKLISKEEQYIRDLDIINSAFIKPLRMANPPVIPPRDLEEFIEDVFGNIFDLRECNLRLLEMMHVRQREQAPVIQRIGDVLLVAAAGFRVSYPTYVGHYPVAEKRMRDEMENNSEFRLFIEKCSREVISSEETLRLDLRHFLNRPSEHLQKYPVLLQAILSETSNSNPDADYLREALEAIKNLQTVAQLRTFQSAMGKGMTGRWVWKDLVSPQLLGTFTLQESRRQSIIFDFVKSEMIYVKDLESIETMYVRPLQNAKPSIIPLDRLNSFIQDVFYNFAELHAHHRRLVDTFHEIQRDEHPRVRSITAAVFDAALNFRESYMEYIPNYPIAAYRIDDEMEKNLRFREFAESCIRHPDAHHLSMKDFINQPISRLLRYEDLLNSILEETPRGHEDREAIPHVIDIIKALGRETEPGVLSSKQKVNLWTYNSSLVFKPGESIDMDLLNESRSLIHTGTLLRRPENGSERGGLTELFILLFDNYLVMTRPRESGGTTKYHVTRRPIPLDLLTLGSFKERRVHRETGIAHSRSERQTDSSASSSGGQTSESGDSVYPLIIHHNGRLGGLWTLYADSQRIRAEWKQKLEEAKGLRRVVQESNKVFEIETLSIDTFNVPAVPTSHIPSWGEGGSITGKVTCSIPFNTPDGRGLVAIGCAEGIWIGFRHDSHSMRRVLHLKMVTQCMMLDEFGLFLVLADKNLFAYHIEALVPATPNQTSSASPTPQKLNGNKEVQFFSIGSIDGRTYVIYMRKNRNDSHFHILEPVIEKINEKTKTSGGVFGILRSTRSEWFRHSREMSLTGDSFDLLFVKTNIAVLSTRGFEILPLRDHGSSKMQSVTIPQREDSRFAPLARKFETCRPIGMFRAREDEYLLCYNEFGIYVDNRGGPSRVYGTIEWEGTAESVAFHAPYILLFDTRFIEIRHIETGRLAQIIPGNDIRCIWDGRGLNSNNVVSGDIPDDQMVQEARVHVVVKLKEVATQGVGRQPITQHVFELIPTIPLYLPGSLASPSNPTYFSPSFTPPRSPQLRPLYRS